MRENMGPTILRADELPAGKSTSSRRPAGLLIADVVTASHGAFIFANDFLRRAVLTDLASIDPDSASAEPTNLIHLVADETIVRPVLATSPILPRHFF